MAKSKNGQTAISSAGQVETTLLTPGPAAKSDDLKLTLGLVGLVWGSGLAGHFTRVKEWPALYLYVLGTFGLTGLLRRGKPRSQKDYITNFPAGSVLVWGGLSGAGLFAMDVANTYAYYRRGGKTMQEMEDILIGQKLVYLFPALIVAEEFLWRGLTLSALQKRGMNKHMAIALSTTLYTLNHFAVAPVGLKERGMMAGMALPIGFVNGYLTLKTKSVWAGVLVHLMTMASMLADIFVIPRLAKRNSGAKAASATSGAKSMHE